MSGLQGAVLPQPDSEDRLPLYARLQFFREAGQQGAGKVCKHTTETESVGRDHHAITESEKDDGSAKRNSSGGTITRGHWKALPAGLLRLMTSSYFVGA
jgi:hypothetical protein